MKQINSPRAPRQRVLDALQHKQPQRVPFSWNFGPTVEMTQVLQSAMLAQGVDWMNFAANVDDIVNISPQYVGQGLPFKQDIWGVVRESQSYGEGVYNEITSYPLTGIRDLTWLKSYPWPDPLAYDYDGFRDEIMTRDPDYLKAHKLAINVCGNPFEIYCWMTGLEESLINLLLFPDVVHTVMTAITDFFTARLHLTLEKVGDLVDILYFADDLGGQQSLLMSLRAYRKIIKPYHARLFTLAHQLAPHASVMFHSDGAVFDILPDLLDAGIDILEAVQTDAYGMEPERLKTTYGDVLCFHGGISVQNLLPFSDPLTVERESRNLVKILGCGGGYIAAPSHAIQVGTPSDNVFAMLRALLGEVDYNHAIEKARFVYPIR